MIDILVFKNKDFEQSYYLNLIIEKKHTSIGSPEKITNLRNYQLTNNFLKLQIKY